MRPFRKEKLASTIQMVIGDLIAHGLNDPRISTLTSVTRVELSPDLLIARVYVSVLGGGGGERATLSGLQHAVRHVRRVVAGRLRVRNCPEIIFLLDSAMKGEARTLRIIDESVRQDAEAAGARGELLTHGSDRNPDAADAEGDTHPTERNRVCPDSVDGVAE
ncbi:MAG: 30S ribosome-binding factor RbfA [Planctomycetes bacterium]|nr:30S ribosome-binding factor RbfA [Planctomycetota bacterium]